MAFQFIGWCCDVDNNGSKHDKIWGYFDNGEPEKGSWSYVQKVYVFWGARGKKNTIHFKDAILNHDLAKLRDQKVWKKNYQEINEKKLLEIWPTFHEDVEMKLCFDVLANRVMPNRK
jgi:hypothetical protein